ncbi:MAG: 1-acyl-sn-glycerol-3-phosphate acyltransferase [Luminiphilus sp.]
MANHASDIVQRDSPWPDDDRPITFLLDASSGLERQLLVDWIEAHRPPGAEAKVVHLSLGDDRKPLEVTPLLNAIASGSNTLVAPLRVAWTPSDRAYAAGPRLIDLLQGPERRPGPLRARYILRRHPERVHLVRGSPDGTGTMAQRFSGKYNLDAEGHGEAFAIFVARQAAIVLDATERKLQGGRYKVPRYIAQSLRSNQTLKDQLFAIASERGEPRTEVIEEANEYFNEMISIPTSFWLDVWIKFSNFCLGLGYERQLNYDPEDLERVRTIVRNHPSALLWTHKTYIDGFVVPKLLFDNNFPVPHFFAGANLNIPVMGRLVKRAGGVFIKRTFADNPVYKAALRHYIGYLMEKRFPLTWSFEGTRSRLGKLMPPKYGVLKYVLEGCHSAGSSDIHIIPVTVSYDLIRDAEEYAREQSGVPKAPESLSWLVGYIRSLARPMGKIYVDFGEPVVLPEAPSPDDRMAVAKIAFQVAVEANRVTPITYPAVICMALLGVYPRAQTESEVAATVNDIITWAKGRSLRMSSDLDQQQLQDTGQLLDLMIGEGIITRFTGGPTTVYGIEAANVAVASYYRNTIVHFFVNKALIELALIAVAESEAQGGASELFWQEVLELRDLFKFEFFYPPTEAFRQEIAAELELLDPNWESELSEGSKGARRLLLRASPHVAHMTLQMYVESYSIAADLLANLAPGETIGTEDFIDRCMNYGKQALLQRRISSEASNLKLLFKNAWDMLTSRNLTDQSLPDYSDARLAQAAALDRLIHRVEISRASAIASRGRPTIRDGARGGL